MGVVPERQEVLKVVGLRLQDLGALRLELPEPVECPLVAVQPSVRMEPGVGDNAMLVLPEPSGMSQTQ